MKKAVGFVLKVLWQLLQIVGLCLVIGIFQKIKLPWEFIGLFIAAAISSAIIWAFNKADEEGGPKIQKRI